MKSKKAKKKTVKKKAKAKIGKSRPKKRVRRSTAEDGGTAGPPK